MKTASVSAEAFLRKHWITGVVLLVLALNALWMIRLAVSVPSSSEESNAPPFELPRLGPAGQLGAKMSLRSLRGKVVLLDFWASWCGPCTETLPELARLDRQRRSEGVQVVGILTNDEDLRGAARMARALGVGYPILVDDGVVSNGYRADQLPKLAVVGRDGILRSNEAGAHSLLELDRLVAPWID